jgi:cell division protein FtsB
MPRSPRPAPDEPSSPAGAPDPRGEGGAAPPPEAPPSDAPSLAGLGIAGVSRRRVAWIALALVAAWIVVGFAGQAADGARASTEVEAQRALNARVAAETDALRRELELVTQERWILQQARAYRLGSRKERPFAIAPGAPALPADAPGSAARRLGADQVERSPLDAWLEVLFGPQR